MNEQAIRWDDLKLVLAIREAGSLSGAGRRLKLSHATIFRRLGEMERKLGVALFERTKIGYLPTAAGEDLADTACRVQQEVQGAERRVIGRDTALSGTLRVTTTDTLLAGLLAPIFNRFRQEHPKIELEVTLSNQVFNLSERDADIAVRPTDTPPEHLVGRRVGVIQQAVYGQTRYCHLLEDNPDLTQADWIGPDRHLAYPPLEKWLVGSGYKRQCRYRVDSMLGMKAAVASGAGLAVLPCYLGGSDNELTRIGEPIPELATGLWLLTHPDLRRVARVSAFMSFVAVTILEGGLISGPG